jgi:hypothetical protein
VSGDTARFRRGQQASADTLLPEAYAVEGALTGPFGRHRLRDLARAGSHLVRVRSVAVIPRSVGGVWAVWSAGVS